LSSLSLPLRQQQHSLRKQALELLLSRLLKEEECAAGFIHDQMVMSLQALQSALKPASSSSPSNSSFSSKSSSSSSSRNSSTRNSLELG